MQRREETNEAGGKMWYEKAHCDGVGVDFVGRRLVAAAVVT